MSKWSPKDQAKLQELQQRKAEHDAINLKRLVAVVECFGCIGNTTTPEEVAEVLIANADAVRDALAPYDSGVRVEAA
jgi:hypothetical protein